MIPKCINHPDRDSTFEVPEDFCDECWVDWWIAEVGSDMNGEQQTEFKNEILRDLAETDDKEEG